MSPRFRSLGIAATARIVMLVRRSPFALPIFLALASLLRVSAQPNGPRGRTIEGKTIFSVNCAACHGLDGKGSERGPDIADRHGVKQRSDASLFRIVRDGVPGTGMPAFRSLGAPAIQAVVRHLRRLQGFREAEQLSGNAKTGQELFFGKAECSRCHMANGEGSFIASDLSSYANGQSSDAVRRAITDPDKNIDARKTMAVVTTLEGVTHRGMVRNEDNFSLQMQTLDGAFHLLSKADLDKVEYESQSLMPGDYGVRLTRGEIDDLVKYLVSTAGNHKSPRKPEEN